MIAHVSELLGSRAMSLPSEAASTELTAPALDLPSGSRAGRGLTLKGD
jgi:hypothetical protein